MVVHLAVGVEATRALARVCAVLVDAGEVVGAVGGHQALGPAVRWRAEVALDAGAHRLTMELAALRVRAARARKTWVHVDGRSWCGFYR